MIRIDIHICDQRRTYRASFATEQQALAFLTPRTSTHAFHLIDEPEAVAAAGWDALLDFLYPTCEHGLSASNCYGPQHYYFDEEEQARGLRNGG